MKYYITGTRRGLGKALAEKYGNCNSLDECDIFVNCKHDGFLQVELLYQAAKLNKKIINIGSHASDYTFEYRYAVEKNALREANHNLFTKGHDTVCINFGYIDTESQQEKKVSKMSVEYCLEIIDWVLNQPHRVKEITITARD
jgi:NAD(P)-dependent dehydrogenase (short-subunit alcohol dehydrogenase family)